MSISYHQEMGDTENLLYPGTPQSPAGLHLLLPSVIFTWSAPPPPPLGQLTNMSNTA